jgi:hypothetical protein
MIFDPARILLARMNFPAPPVVELNKTQLTG